MNYKRLLVQMIGLTSVLLHLVVCGTLQPTPTFTPILPTFTPTNTPTPTIPPTIAPTPTQDLNQTLLPTAGPLCEAAFSSPVSEGSPVGPVLCLLNEEYEPGGWRVLASVLSFEAQSASEVKTIVCITERRTKTGGYTDGTDAYRRIWVVRLVSWPDGAVLGEETFSGGAPPFQKHGSSDGYGAWPITALEEWLFRILGDKTFLFAGVEVRSLAFSPDGKTLALGSDDETVKLWDVATGQEVRTLGRGVGGCVDCLAFSPDGKTLAFESDDNMVHLWDVATGQEVRTLHGHSGRGRTIAFSPDGKTLASNCSAGKVKLWDLATGQEIHTLSGDPWSEGVAFSPDGKTLAGSSRYTVKLWDVATGQEVRTLSGHTNYVMSVAFSPDGKILASGSYDDTVKLWNVATGQEVRTLSVVQDGCSDDIAFSPDGKTLAVDFVHTVKLWDVATGQEVRILSGHARGVRSLAFSPDGKTLAVGSGYAVKLWDMTAEP